LRKTGQFRRVDGGPVRGQQKSGDKIKEWPIIKTHIPWKLSKF